MISARCPAKGRPSLRAGTSQRTMVLSSPHRACWLGRRIPLQRGPVVVQPFALNLPDLALAHPEALGDDLAGLGHRHLVILGVYQLQENLLAALFGKVFSRTVFGHALSPSALRSSICEGPSHCIARQRRVRLRRRKVSDLQKTARHPRSAGNGTI